MTATAQSSAIGYPPKLATGNGNPEALKYGKLWEMPDYRAISPGETLASEFCRIAKPRPGASVIDFGCGTGRGGFALAVFAQMDVTLVDFVRNCLDEEIRQACDTQSHTLRFVKADLEKSLSIHAEYGFCCDVMEHIPQMRVPDVLQNILHAARHVFFSISTEADACGQLIGEELHVSIHPYDWWLTELNRAGCLVHWSESRDGVALFYVTAWSDGREVVDAATLNVSDQEARDNVAANCAAGWQQVTPHPTNDVDVMILGGGPSLNESIEQIKTMRAEGVKLITLNGSYNWAINCGMKPSAQIMVDARPFNARFTKPVIDDCKYLLASQCHPSVFEGLPKDRTYLWHTSIAHIEDILKTHFETYWPVPSCSTVLLTGILLLRQLGFRRFHLFGCDSCVSADKQQHHAYAQAENDHDLIAPVIVNPGGRLFYAHPWMIGQAQSFLDMIKFLGDEIELEIHGDGLLKHILDAGAAAQIETVDKQ